MVTSKDFFNATPLRPFHLSVGAVIFDTSHTKVLVHYYPKLAGNNIVYENIYTLMHETVERGELIEETLRRGIEEEFGGKASFWGYLGSKVNTHTWFEKENTPTPVEKTVLYFIGEISDLDIKKATDDDPDHRFEKDTKFRSTIVWEDPAQLVVKMKLQYDLYNIADMNQAEIIVRAQEYLRKNNL